MLSVKESADMLGVTPARVRALIAQKALPAQKVGRSWVIKEEDILDRLSRHPKAGRPVRTTIAAFYVAVADFFLQQRQRNLVAQGAY